jgi:hypothetical protein
MLRPSTDSKVADRLIGFRVGLLDRLSSQTSSARLPTRLISRVMTLFKKVFPAFCLKYRFLGGVEPICSPKMGKFDHIFVLEELSVSKTLILGLWLQIFFLECLGRYRNSPD